MIRKVTITFYSDDGHGPTGEAAFAVTYALGRMMKALEMPVSNSVQIEAQFKKLQPRTRKAKEVQS